MIKHKRFLGNVNTLEVHDTQNEKTSCQLDEIKVEHRKWYDSVGGQTARRRILARTISGLSPELG